MIGNRQTTEEISVCQELDEIWSASSSCVGYLVSLGKALQEEGFKEIRNEYVPRIQEALGGILPRVIPGYATLMWFTAKVHIEHLK